MTMLIDEDDDWMLKNWDDEDRTTEAMMEDFHLHYLRNQYEYNQLNEIDDDEEFGSIEDAWPKSNEQNWHFILEYRAREGKRSMSEERLDSNSHLIEVYNQPDV